MLKVLLVDDEPFILGIETFSRLGEGRLSDCGNSSKWDGSTGFFEEGKGRFGYCRY